MFRLIGQRRPRIHPKRFWVLGAALLAVSAAVAEAQQSAQQPAIPQALIPAGDTKPIQLYAESVSTWVQDGKRAILLKGKVLVEQGQVSLRMPSGVVWVDEDRKKVTGIYQLDVYGEGGVQLDNGSATRKGTDAIVNMTTRGEIRIRAYADKVAQKDLSADPVFQRALKLKSRPPALVVAAPDPVVKPAVGKSDPGAKPPVVQTQGSALPGDVAPPQFPAPAPTVPVGPPPPPPGAGANPFLPVPSGDGEPRKFTIRPRSSQGINATNYAINGETVVVVSSPVILTVTNPVTHKVIADIEADRLAFWTKGNPNEVFGNLRSNQGQTSRQLEFYLSGNVEIRNQSGKDGKETEILRADEVYYDVSRSVAIAMRGDLEIREPKIPYPLHFEADEIIQLNPKMYTGKAAKIYSTVLPSDPGLKIEVREFTLNEEQITKQTIFGKTYIDPKTGAPMPYTQRIFTGYDTVLRLEGVPFFALPKISGDVSDPLGPLENISFNYNHIFGFQLFTTFNVYKLLGIVPEPDTRWRLFVDGMTARGPAMGTEYDFAGKNMFGFPNKYQGLVKAYGIYDTGTDILGGGRGTEIFLTPTETLPVSHPQFRGRFISKINMQEMPDGFSVLGQFSAISDRTFLEQFFRNEWLNDLNQETYLYVKQQQDIWAWTFLVEPHIQRWLTETEWLPRADGHVLGYSLFDRLTYNMKASAGYAQLQPTAEPQFAYSPTDAATNTGRFDLWNEISLPLALGPFKVIPYVVGDVTYYTQDLSGDDVARLYGAVGVRASIPFSKLYPDIQSDIFNLDGIYHKITLTGNYYNAQSNTPFSQLPQLDRFNDDASDQALRDLFLRQTTLNPANGAFLTSSPLFNPQVYALRRLIDTQVDTLDTINVIQLGLQQRWQTKRGLPGDEHVIDWMTLNLGASIFPHSNRDNFGQLWGVLEYDWLWNIGDRTALISDGWFETISGGPRVFNFGVLLNRPDRTNFYLGYRQIDPLESRAVVASVTYAFSAKYAITASTFYDFGVHTQTNTLMISRIGTDLQINLGFSYNSTLNNFGVALEILPNLIPRPAGATGHGLANLGGR